LVASYDLQPGNGASRILQIPGPTWDTHYKISANYTDAYIYIYTIKFRSVSE